MASKRISVSNIGNAPQERRASNVLTSDPIPLHSRHHLDVLQPGIPHSSRRNRTIATPQLSIDPTRLSAEDTNLTPNSPHSAWSDASFEELLDGYPQLRPRSDTQLDDNQDLLHVASFPDYIHVKGTIDDGGHLSVTGSPFQEQQSEPRSSNDTDRSSQHWRDPNFTLSSGRTVRPAHVTRASAGCHRSQTTMLTSPVIKIEDDEHIENMDLFSPDEAVRSPQHTGNEINRRGLSPEDRQDLSGRVLPRSLNEEQADRVISLNNSNVQAWLAVSGSTDLDADLREAVVQSPDMNRLTVPLVSRPRAASEGRFAVEFLQAQLRQVVDARSKSDADSDDDSSDEYDRYGSGGNEADETQPLNNNDESYPSTGANVDSSTKAIERYTERIKMFDAASRTATMGTMKSKRRSLDSLYDSMPGVSHQSSPGLDGLRAAARQRYNPLLQILRKRSGSRRTNNASQREEPSGVNDLQQQHPMQGLTPSKIKTSLSRSSSRRGYDQSQPMTPLDETQSPSSHNLSAFRNTVANVFRRAPSKGHDDRRASDATISQRGLGGTTSKPSLVHSQFHSNLHTQHGADTQPPNRAPAIASSSLPAQWNGTQVPVPTAPTAAAFRTHVEQLYPRLDRYLIDRIVEHQLQRYERLANMRTSRPHSPRRAQESSAVVKGQTRSSSRDASTRAPRAYRVVSTDTARDHESTYVTNMPPIASFSEGFPLPPVAGLPASFQCNWCFKKLDNIAKPSDWTKHILEDLQPYICTFQSCSPPKQFKRKADWVRHDLIHRQREWWECDAPRCSHQSYRKDNFTSHLVDQHKYKNTDLTKIVDSCKRLSTKSATEEPCQFCNRTHDEWKPLLKCLAAHMEQIALPVLVLVNRVNNVEASGHNNSDQLHKTIEKFGQHLVLQEEPSVATTEAVPMGHSSSGGFPSMTGAQMSPGAYLVPSSTRGQAVSGLHPHGNHMDIDPYLESNTFLQQFEAGGYANHGQRGYPHNLPHEDINPQEVSSPPEIDAPLYHIQSAPSVLGHPTFAGQQGAYPQQSYSPAPAAEQWTQLHTPSPRNASYPSPFLIPAQGQTQGSSPRQYTPMHLPPSYPSPSAVANRGPYITSGWCGTEGCFQMQTLNNMQALSYQPPGLGNSHLDPTVFFGDDIFGDENPQLLDLRQQPQQLEQTYTTQHHNLHTVQPQDHYHPQSNNSMPLQAVTDHGRTQDAELEWFLMEQSRQAQVPRRQSKQRSGAVKRGYEG